MDNTLSAEEKDIVTLFNALAEKMDEDTYANLLSFLKLFAKAKYREGFKAGYKKGYKTDDVEAPNQNHDIRNAIKYLEPIIAMLDK